MKKLIALLLVFILCFCMTACGDEDVITFSEDYEELYYNGRTYIKYPNSNGKYQFYHDNDADGWHEIAKLPYVLILAAYTYYYGDDVNNPNIITTGRAHNIYVREDITLDHDSTLCVPSAKGTFEFKISDVTAGEPIKEESVDSALDVLSFDAAFKEYPCVSLDITICKYNEKLYLQDVWNSDYYPIKDAFREFLDRLFVDFMNT